MNDGISNERSMIELKSTSMSLDEKGPPKAFEASSSAKKVTDSVLEEEEEDSEEGGQGGRDSENATNSGSSSIGYKESSKGHGTGEIDEEDELADVFEDPAGLETAAMIPGSDSNSLTRSSNI